MTKLTNFHTQPIHRTFKAFGTGPTHRDVCVHRVLPALAVDEPAGELVHGGGDHLQAGVRAGEGALQEADLALQHVQAGRHRGSVRVRRRGSWGISLKDWARRDRPSGGRSVCGSLCASVAVPERWAGTVVRGSLRAPPVETGFNRAGGFFIQ